MKRSTINANLTWAAALLREYRFSLPAFAWWSAEEWMANREALDVVRAVRLGWEVKDFSEELGATLFTLRNGRHDDPSVGVRYCEKVILFRDGKRLPLHYHRQKTEDVINRAAGVMQLRLYNTTPSGELDRESEVHVRQDGILRYYQVMPHVSNAMPYVAVIIGIGAALIGMVVKRVGRILEAMKHA